MALLDEIRARRELVKRLVLAELLARPGRGPLALRSPAALRAGAAPRGQAGQAELAAPPGTTPTKDEP